MTYKNIDLVYFDNGNKRKVINHADMLLRDAYGMFKLPIHDKSGEGACKFSILILMLLIIDGISVYFYPTKEVISDQEKRFKKLIRDKLYWGPIDKG